MNWPFNKTNYVIFGIGVLSIVIGYLIISFNTVDSIQSTRVGPVILFIGYCIIIPISIMYNQKK